jgi:hypothetical protein
MTELTGTSNFSSAYSSHFLHCNGLTNVKRSEIHELYPLIIPKFRDDENLHYISDFSLLGTGQRGCKAKTLCKKK